MASFYEGLHTKKSVSDEKENAQSRSNVDKWIFRILLLLIGVTPLIVMAHIEQVVSPLISNVSILTSGTKGELFTHFKALFVLIITLVAGLLLLAKVFFMDGAIRKTKLNYALGAFTVAIVLSTIFSSTISVALNGLYNRSDGAISWLCYIALMFIAMNIEYPKKVVSYILYSLYPFVLINLFIITMSFYDKDLLKVTSMQKVVSLFLPEGASISEGSTLIGTLNQWNYMSGMFAIMTVMFLTAAILEKNIGQAIGHLIIAVMSIAVMLMSISTSGFLTICVMMIVVIFAAFKSKKRAHSFALLAVFVVATAPVFHVLASKEDKVWKETFGFFTDNNPYGWKPESKAAMLDNLLFEPAYATKQFELPILPNSSMSAGSGRTYIWDKTFDLFKEKPFLGYGLDTIMYTFPHYNIEARAGLQDENTIVDKPHNMYIGLLYGTGTFGILSVLYLICGTVFTALKKVMKNNEPIIWILMVAWGAYLIQALFNDSLPGTSAMMWAIAGILLASILTNKEQENGRND